MELSSLVHVFSKTPLLVPYVISFVVAYIFILGGRLLNYIGRMVVEWPISGACIIICPS